MSTVNNSSSGGIGVLGLLGIFFIVLKLTGYISWSWWWVMAPLWGGFALVFGIMFFVILFTVIMAFGTMLYEKYKK